MAKEGVVKILAIEGWRGVELKIMISMMELKIMEKKPKPDFFNPGGGNNIII